MRKWLVNSILLLALAGNAAMGMPLHSNEESCPMGKMDCCKKAALAQSATPQVTAARLCCSLNCSQTGTTSSNGVQVQPQTQPTTSAHLTGVQPVQPPPMLFGQSRGSHGPPIDSHPAYIRHLALLI